MKSRIIREITSRQWAITEPAFRSILAAAHDNLSDDDYQHFHSQTKEEKECLSDTFGKRAEGTYYTGVRGDIGFLMLDGPIIPRATWLTNASGLVSLDALTNEFRALEKDTSINKIVMLMDSPGGAITGVSDFGTLIKNSSKEVFTYTWMAASAAYWIASASKKIAISPTGEAGSIGVVFGVTDYTERDAKEGIRHLEIVSSQSPNKRLSLTSDEGKAAYQDQVNYLADEFISTVAENRNVSVEAVMNTFGKGLMLMAKPAVSVGMVDNIIGVDAFVEDLITKNTLFDMSARADNKREVCMPEQSGKATYTAEQLQEATATAIAEERSRIAGIEAIADTFTNDTAPVRAAVATAIDSYKYKADMTEVAVMRAVMAAANDARKEASAQVSDPRIAAAAIAQHASKGTPSTETDEEAAIAARTKGLAVAVKKVIGE